MKLKQGLLIVLISASSAIGSVALYNKFSQSSSSSLVGEIKDGKLPANYAGFNNGHITGAPAELIDFTKAANAAVPAVVHIKTKVPAKKVVNNLGRRNNGYDDFFNQFFGEGYGPNIIPEQRASGSGVILSEDGYIVTNNHVISNNAGGIADEITVTLNSRKTYKARLIGRDPSSDIAVLKIDGTKLPYMVYGTSDNLQLGQWVLAVGYPLTLETTVTAGIVSATGRSIGINSRQVKNNETPIESFIQTDAAVNQGNSGGALVNTSGQLIGINSAILAPNGTYAGYSFAIPVSLVRKMVNDIIQFGDVQRGYLGIRYFSKDDISDDEAKAAGIPANIDGVYVSDVVSDGGAYAAGLRKGDVITKVNGASIISGSQLSVQIAGFRPGDKVPITYTRNGKESTAVVILKKKPEIVAAAAPERLGGELSDLAKSRASGYGISGGVVVNKVAPNGILRNARIQAGFIIVSIITAEGEQDVTSVQGLTDILKDQTGSVRVKGIYPDYGETYTYPLNLEQ